VVGGMPVQGLPGAVGGVVVAEALGGPGARDYERPSSAVEPTLDLERHAVAESLRVVLCLGCGEGPEGHDLDPARPEPAEVGGEGLVTDHAVRIPGERTLRATLQAHSDSSRTGVASEAETRQARAALASTRAARSRSTPAGSVSRGRRTMSVNRVTP